MSKKTLKQTMQLTAFERTFDAMLNAYLSFVFCVFASVLLFLTSKQAFALIAANDAKSLIALCAAAIGLIVKIGSAFPKFKAKKKYKKR